MTTIFAALEAASRIIIAAPIFFTTVPAQTKAMIDRTQVCWSRKYVLKLPPPRPDRVGAFICVGGFVKGRRFFECAQRVVSVWFLVQDIAYKQGLFFPGVDTMGDAANHPEAMRRCRELGLQL